MRWVISTSLFSPSVGGVETVARLLADELHRQGEQVTILTDTAQHAGENFPYRVVRMPSWLESIRVLSRADALIQISISIRYLLPLVICYKRHVVFHQTWYERANGLRAFRDRVKLWIAKCLVNAAPSAALARHIGAGCVVIPNPYDSGLYQEQVGVARDRDILFAGRLVSDKGVDLLLEAAATLHAQGESRRLTIVGSGPEERALRELARTLGIEELVSFVGAKTGRALAHEFASHRLLVVPSRWHEPFGIVALEGIACGCEVIGTAGGGLGDAIGPCGTTVPNGDVALLAKAISVACSSQQETAERSSRRRSHLALHTPSAVLDQLRGLLS